MKKNLPVIIVVVLLIIVIAVSFYFMMNKNNEPSNINRALGTNTQSTNVPETKKDIIYAYNSNISSNEASLKNDFEYPDPIKNIDGKNYKNINSIPANILGTYNYDKYTDGEIQYINHDNQEERLFNEDRIIIPMALFLMDDSVNAFYNYYDELYFIPVIKCNSEDEERIVFRDHELTIAKNTGNIYINGKQLDINYNFNNLDFKGLFYSYFILNPELSNTQINLYKTNIDMDESTFDIRLTTASNSDDQLESLCNTFIIIKSNGSFDLCVAPMDLGMHVGDYSNLFYKESNSVHFNESGEEIKNNSVKEYYLFDNGFKVISED